MFSDGSKLEWSVGQVIALSNRSIQQSPGKNPGSFITRDATTQYTIAKGKERQTHRPIKASITMPELNLIGEFPVWRSKKSNYFTNRPFQFTAVAEQSMFSAPPGRTNESDCLLLNKKYLKSNF